MSQRKRGAERVIALLCAHARTRCPCMAPKCTYMNNIITCKILTARAFVENIKWTTYGLWGCWATCCCFLPTRGHKASFMHTSHVCILQILCMWILYNYVIYSHDRDRTTVKCVHKWFVLSHSEMLSMKKCVTYCANFHAHRLWPYVCDHMLHSGIRFRVCWNKSNITPRLRQWGNHLESFKGSYFSA